MCFSCAFFAFVNYNLFPLYLLVCFLKERERIKAWSWMHGEGEDLGENGE